LIIRAFLRVGCAAAVAFTLVAHSPGSSLSAADYTRYHTYDQLTAALRELAKAHPNLAKVVEVAKSREGRSVWAIEIANAAGTPPPARPALMIAANFEGDQVIGSACRAASHRLCRQSGNQAAARRAHLLHRPARKSGWGRGHVRAGESGAQDQQREVRQRQRRPDR